MTEKLTLTVNGEKRVYEAPEEISMKTLYQAMELSEQVDDNTSAFDQLDKLVDIALVLIDAVPTNHLTKDELLAGMSSQDFAQELVPFVQGSIERLSSKMKANH
ncbi:phage tail assembly chaperone G [Furfurilactobacillus sp. WILCCON 0119]|uniref:phage tail assembly chaperone G n=1 Tax=Furfurilactobacillus entadae TaxID=2922307 RepID=UPI0035E6EB8C